MARQDLVDFIKAQIQKGLSKDDINKTLLSAGWRAEDIEESYRYAELPPITIEQSSQNRQFLASPTDLLKEAWDLYKVRARTFIGVLLAQFFALLPLAIVIMFSFSFFIGNYAIGYGMQSNFSPIVLIFIFFLFLILAIIIQFWSQAAMLFAVKDGEENIGVKESYRRGWHKIGSIFWVGLLSGIIVLGGYLFFVIPGIIFSTWFSLAVIIVIAEGLGGMDALLKSKSYVTGYWWEVFWRFLFIGLVIGGINIIFGLSAWIINFIAQLAGNTSLSVIGLIFNLIGSIVSFLLAPLTVIYTFLVYKNLKSIKGEVKAEFSGGEKAKFMIAGILGILLFFGMLAIPILLINSSLGSAKNKAMDAERQADISQLRRSLEIYAIDHNDKYPESLNQLLEKSENLNLSSIPTDPKTNLPYEYQQLRNGEDFRICAALETGEKKCLSGYGNSAY